MKSPRADLVTTLELQASAQGNVVRLGQARDLGITSGQRVAQARARRWEIVPHRGIVTGPPTDETRLRLALVRVGQGAAIGGVTALHLVGLHGFEEPRLHVWVRKSFSKEKVDGVRVHESRRWTADDVKTSGIPRSRPGVAAVQAALWSVTARQAATVLAMAVQQRIVDADELAEQFERVRRHAFRTQLRLVIADIAGGAQSINELDFARLCRDHGLPEPSRQVPHRSPQGRIYLDVYWDAYGVRLEVNGAGHGILTTAMKDEVRAVHAQTEGDAAVQVSVLTLRTDPEPLLRALADLLRSRGWRG